MLALIQRVNWACVSIGGQKYSEIQQGLLVFLGVQKQDGEPEIKRMAEKIVGYRVFSDENDQMNLNVKQVDGEILIVSQFTLAADTKKGMRPSFSSAAPPEQAKIIYQKVIQSLHSHEISIKTGEFAADMQVSLENDGPVTFMLSC